MPERQLPTFTGPNRTGRTQVNFVDVGRRVLTVTRIEDLSAYLRRIVLSGDDLADDFPWVQFAPADHVKVCFPDPVGGELVVPELTPRGWWHPEGAPDPIVRDYTVRSYDPGARELAIDFVLHDHGVAGRWAIGAQVGQRLGILGPRGNVLFPADYAWYFAAGDATALPAITRYLHELPARSRALAIIEVPDAAGEHDLGLRPGIEVRWVHRESGGAGALEAAIRDVAWPTSADWFVFAAGEAGMLVPIRRYFRRELGLAKDRVEIDGYWKLGVAGLDHHAVDLDAD